MAKYLKKSANIMLIALIMLLLIGVIACAFYQIENIAVAQSDNFDVIFPTSSYFQSSSPTLISGNEDYLLVYDKSSSSMYSRSNDSAKTIVYPVSFANVANIFVVGKSAFLYADDRYFAIDLSIENSTPQDITLTTPSDISYFNSDGTHLYAKSTAGYISVYDENFNIAFGADNVYNDDLFAGKPVIAGEDNNLYAFTIAYGNPFFVKYDLESHLESKGVQISKYVQEAYVGDIIFALETLPSGDDSTKNIVGIDKQSGEVLLTTSLHPDKFFAFGNRLFTIEGKMIAIYTLSSDHKSLEKTSTISMAGNDLEHFDNPQDISKDGENIVVADSNNNRLSIIKNGMMSEVKLEFSPLRVHSVDGVNYVVHDNTLTVVEGGKVTYQLEVANIKDVTYLDKLYVLTTDGVYTLIGDRLVKLASVENGRRISTAKDGNNIYILKDTEIARMNKMGEWLPTALSGDFANVKDITIDYKGQISLVYSGKVEQFYKGVKTNELTLSSSTINATINSAYLDDTTLYFSADECLIAKCTVGAKSKYEEPAITVDTDVTHYSFATISKGDKVWYDHDYREESASFATNEVVLVSTIISQNFTYAIYDGKVYGVAQSDVELLHTTPLSGDYVTKCDTTLYKLPHFDDGKIDVESGAHVTLISDTCGYDSGAWTLVEYDGNTYFAKSEDIEEYIVIIDTPEIEKVYGKAKGDRVGGLVKVYSAPTEKSISLLEVVDGTKVEIVEEVGNFYRVIVDGVSGYMLKDEVVVDALTTVQIIAIVLCCVVALAGAGVFMAIHLTRKHDEEKKRREEING